MGRRATFLAPHAVSYGAQMRSRFPSSILHMLPCRHRPSVELWAVSSTERSLQPASHSISVCTEDEPGW